MTTLTNEEIDQCRNAFMQCDHGNSGSIQTTDLQEVLFMMGQKTTNEELFLMVTTVDDKGSGGIEFSEFLKLILNEKGLKKEMESDVDTVDAFVALGGNMDKTGIIKTDKLDKVIQDFELLIGMDDLLREANVSSCGGFIDYDEFKSMLSPNP